MGIGFDGSLGLHVRLRMGGSFGLRFGCNFRLHSEARILLGYWGFQLRATLQAELIPFLHAESADGTCGTLLIRDVDFVIEQERGFGIHRLSCKPRLCRLIVVVAQQ